MERKKFKKGTVIIEKGSINNCAYIVASGKIEITGPEEVKTELRENQIFGEMNLLGDKPSTETVKAIKTSELDIITRKELNSFLKKNDNPLLNIISTLLERIKETDKILTDKHEVNDAGEKIVDRRYLVISGLNEISSDALRSRKVEVRTFPYRVGRFAVDNVKNSSKIESEHKERQGANDLYMYEEGPNYYISINHFVLDKQDGQFVLIDRGSRSGVLVDDIPVKGSCVLKEENHIIIGSSYSPFLFKIEIKGAIDIVKEEAVEMVEIVEPTFDIVGGDGNSGFSITS